jgi:hypothetical protein
MRKSIVVFFIATLLIGCDSSSSLPPRVSTAPAQKTLGPDPVVASPNTQTYPNEEIGIEILEDKVSISSEGSDWDKVLKIPIRNNLRHLTVSQIEIYTWPSRMSMVRNEKCPTHTETIEVRISPGQTKTVTISPPDLTGCDYKNCVVRNISKVQFTNGDFFEDGNIIPSFFNHKIREADKN